jgi:glyoxylase I family protein
MMLSMGLRIGGFATLLQVFDMPSSLAFYRDVLGFEVASDVPADDRCDWVLLKLHESELMLNTAYEADARPPAPEAARISAHADTALFFGCQDVDAAYTYLQQRGIAVKAPVVTRPEFTMRSRQPSGEHLLAAKNRPTKAPDSPPDADVGVCARPAEALQGAAAPGGPAVPQAAAAPACSPGAGAALRAVSRDPHPGNARPVGQKAGPAAVPGAMRSASEILGGMAWLRRTHGSD